MTTPFMLDAQAFNPAFHAFMMMIGATHERAEAEWEDAGDAENGPDLTGVQARDLYVLDGIHYAAFEDGTVDHCEELYTFDTQGIECDGVAR